MQLPRIPACVARPRPVRRAQFCCSPCSVLLFAVRRSPSQSAVCCWPSQFCCSPSHLLLLAVSVCCSPFAVPFAVQWRLPSCSSFVRVNAPTIRHRRFSSSRLPARTSNVESPASGLSRRLPPLAVFLPSPFHRASLPAEPPSVSLVAIPRRTSELRFKLSHPADQRTRSRGHAPSLKPG